MTFALINAGKLEKVFNNLTNSKKIHEGILLIENTSGEFSFVKTHGNKELNSPLFMASITKLFTTTCILILLEQDKISLEDKVSKYLDKNILRGIHVFNGKDYSLELTIFDLLFQVSGLPDVYLEGKNSLIHKVTKSDFHFTFSDIIARTKELKPHFQPRKKGKAYYADINFDILGQIVEKVSGLTLSKVYKKFIFEPLGLLNTYLPEKETDEIPKIYYKKQAIHRPKFVISSNASGGCITTAQELMIFVKAFFGGKLFNDSLFNCLSTYNKLQFSMSPIQYGGGYMRIPLSGLVSFFIAKGELIGHSGSTGSFAFYYPMKNLFFVGDVNQMSDPSLPIKLSIQLAMAVK